MTGPSHPGCVHDMTCLPAPPLWLCCGLSLRWSDTVRTSCTSRAMPRALRIDEPIEEQRCRQDQYRLLLLCFLFLPLALVFYLPRTIISASCATRVSLRQASGTWAYIWCHFRFVYKNEYNGIIVGVLYYRVLVNM